jgi:hypothetical protein
MRGQLSGGFSLMRLRIRFQPLIADLHETWKHRGIEAIERTIDEHPGQYLKVIAMLMPKDMNVNVRKFDDLSDE